MTNKKIYQFPNEAEIERVIKRVRRPVYRRINKGLKPDATTEEKIKYELCQNISRYARENNLTEKELGEKMGIDQVKVEYILFAHINRLILEELVAYVDNLHIPLEIKIVSQNDRQEITPRTH